MRKNLFTVITGENVILVSYKKEHVVKYHEWMKSPELQQLTGSEPLTLYEEHKMQVSWLNDPKKCTFIILDKKLFIRTKDEVQAMIGDTNLFFNDPDNPNVAEAEIMIAEKKARGKKMGWEAMLLMLHYGIADLEVNRYVVKVGDENMPSLSMFKKIGFEFVERSEVFKQITLAKEVDLAFRQWLEKNLNFIKIKNCDMRIIAAIAAKKKAIEQAKKDKEKRQKEKEAKEKEKENKEKEDKKKEESPEF